MVLRFNNTTPGRVKIELLNILFDIIIGYCKIIKIIIVN